MGYTVINTEKTPANTFSPPSATNISQEQYRAPSTISIHLNQHRSAALGLPYNTDFSEKNTEIFIQDWFNAFGRDLNYFGIPSLGSFIRFQCYNNLHSFYIKRSIGGPGWWTLHSTQQKKSGTFSPLL